MKLAASVVIDCVIDVCHARESAEMLIKLLCMRESKYNELTFLKCEFE